MNRNYNISDTAFKLASFAIQGMLYEVSCFPSPGLVSPVSDGAHKDMDYYMFLDSTASLTKAMVLCAQAGLTDDSPDMIFNNIRKVGMVGEEEMFSSTNGINTHKGMLFLMGIGCAAAAKAIFDDMGFHNIPNIVMEMTKGLTQKELDSTKLKEKTNVSHGEKLFLKHGVTGVRGEVEKGLPVIFNFALDFYDKCEDLYINDRLVHTLLGIMQYCEDTTILHRHSLEVLREVQAKAKLIVGLGGMKTDLGANAVYLLDREYKQRNISPGGSADLLGLTIFFNSVKTYMNK